MPKTKTARLIKTEIPKEIPVREPKLSRFPKTGATRDIQVKSQYFSRAVGKALEVLEFLQAELTPLSMNEI
ncbi:MAG: hypothetical protein ABI158_08410, partial [Edaphobacter sp.]